ncbi:MAG: hypothetical protein MKZ68_00570 [Candidatus Thalassarchaeum sp.]|nr:hypothetical protein [Candidatus Thalassarchaeum sp.]
MHVMTKVTLGLGTVLFVISSIAFVIGGAELDSALEEVTPNSVGYEYWTGDTSTEFNGELKWSSVYYVFVEEGYEVDVEVSGSGYFESCEEYGDCDDFDVFPGYDYIGDLEVDVSGDYEVDFSETEGRIIDVKITEEEIPVSGLLGAFGGCCGICGALFLLIVGGVMALTLKDQPKVQTSIQFDNDLVVVNENPEGSEYDQDDST